MGPDGWLHDRIPQVVEQWGATRVLKRLSVDDKSIDIDNPAADPHPLIQSSSFRRQRFRSCRRFSDEKPTYHYRLS
jgi:hypothetical protein